MPDFLLSVGLDVGTTTTQLVVSRLTLQNRASSFAVPQMQITDRQVLYRSPVRFTPLLDAAHVDGAAIRELVTQEYRQAGITKEDVDTGAIIITGETSRKENARAVLDAVSDHAGDFVVATAGPHLESVLAAKGAGAVTYSATSGKRILHMDIGGGTSNLALIEAGHIVCTGCLNVGGRLLKLDDTGRIQYVSPALAEFTPLKVGDIPTAQQVQALAYTLATALEMAAGLRPATELLEKLWTKEAGQAWELMPTDCVISFSGGVADCIEKEHPALAFGDIGPALGQAIRSSLLCRGDYMLGAETIQATVIGAGSHSAQLSGSTVFHRGVNLPMKNLPVAVFSQQEQAGEDLPNRIRQRLGQMDQPRAVLALPGYRAATYAQVKQLARAIVDGTGGSDVIVCLEADMAKALGHYLCLLLPETAGILCIDGVKLQQLCYLDVGAPAGPCLPVVIKTLVLSKEG